MSIIGPTTTVRNLGDRAAAMVRAWLQVIPHRAAIVIAGIELLRRVIRKGRFDLGKLRLKYDVRAVWNAVMPA